MTAQEALAGLLDARRTPQLLHTAHVCLAAWLCCFAGRAQHARSTAEGSKPAQPAQLLLWPLGCVRRLQQVSSWIVHQLLGDHFRSGSAGLKAALAGQRAALPGTSSIQAWLTHFNLQPVYIEHTPTHH